MPAPPQTIKGFLTADEYSIQHNGQIHASIKRSVDSLWYGAGQYLFNVLFCELYDFIKFEFSLDETEEVFIELITEEEFTRSI